MTIYNFDEMIERRHSNSLKWDKYQGTDILPLWVADMDFRVSPAITHALKKRVEHGIFGYSRPPDELIQVVINMLKEHYDWPVEKDWVVWLPGVVPGLSAACRAIGQPGDEAICCTPIYHHFLHVPARSNRQLKTVPLQLEQGRWTFDFDALESAFTEKTALFMLCNPHNPTGTVFNKDELQHLASLCAQHNVVICSDDIHCGLILDEHKKHIPISVAAPEIADKTITLMAPSKTFNLAGLNASFAIIPDRHLRQQLTSATKSILPSISPFAFDAALAAFRDSEDWRQQLLVYLRQNRDLLNTKINQLEPLSMTKIEGTYLAWINIEQLGLDNPIKYFESFGLGFSPGKEFGDDRFIRLNFGCTQATLIEALKRLEIALTCHRQ